MTTPIDLEPAARRMVQLVEAVPDDALSRPTPCDRYSVGDLLDHIGGLSIAFSGAATKNPLSGGPSADRTRLAAHWRSEIPSAVLALAEDWKDPPAWTGMTAAGGLDLPGDVAGLIALEEIVVHEWDLARAIGKHDVYGGPGLDAVLGFMRETLADPVEGLFGPEVPIPEDAELFDRILGMSGRDPGWRPPGTGASC